jgi:hypothetical protein
MPFHCFCKFFFKTSISFFGRLFDQTHYFHFPTVFVLDFACFLMIFIIFYSTQNVKRIARLRFSTNLYLSHLRVLIINIFWFQWIGFFFKKCSYFVKNMIIPKKIHWHFLSRFSNTIGGYGIPSLRLVAAHWRFGSPLLISSSLVAISEILR